jgi:uncharacterized metal-binding protein
MPGIEDISAMKDDFELSCPVCGVQACRSTPDEKTQPSFCPMRTEAEQLAAVERAYVEDAELRRWACESARTESSGYCRRTRIEEVMDFARRIGATRLGIAHCIGLISETRIAREIFLRNGFEVEAICCKVGSIAKEKVGVKDEEKIHPGQFEALCNPVAQAELLARVGTHLNILIGLWPRQLVFQALACTGDRARGQGPHPRAQSGCGLVYEQLLLSTTEGAAGQEI